MAHSGRIAPMRVLRHGHGPTVDLTDVRYRDALGMCSFEGKQRNCGLEYHQEDQPPKQHGLPRA